MKYFNLKDGKIITGSLWNKKMRKKQNKSIEFGERLFGLVRNSWFISSPITRIDYNGKYKIFTRNGSVYVYDGFLGN